ncbi:hypothetical protein LNP25_22770 [Klebsiella variicola subsp. variicola]|nr:hypothetical protein [Klebsiella variicola subsp. variicola]
MAMKPPWRRAFTTPIPKITCVTRKTRRWIWYKEVNTGTNLPAQIDLYSVDGEEYKFLCMAKAAVPPIKPISIRKPKR